MSPRRSSGPALRLRDAARFKPPIDLIAAEAKLLQDLARVLADQWGRPRDFRRRLAELHRRRHDLDFPSGGMLVTCDCTHVLDLRIALGDEMGFHLAAPDVDI
jgi:hypothetical protein